MNLTAKIRLLFILASLSNSQITTGATLPVNQNGKSTDTTLHAFSCAGKVIGGYYADVKENCQMFHVCTIGENGEIRDIVFRCLNGTVFDQETRVCERQEEVNCAQSESFFYLNNELYGPGIIPETANAPLKQVHGQTERQKLTRDKETTTTQSETKSMCKGKTQAILQADFNTNCVGFSVCIPQGSHGEVSKNFFCADENHGFDQGTGMCSRRDVVECSSQNPPFQISLKDAQIFSVYILGLCSAIRKGNYIIDSRSGCEQYIQCPTDHSAPIPVYRCPEGLLFSQERQKCVSATEVACARDIFSLLKLVELKNSGSLVNNKFRNIGIKSSLVDSKKPTHGSFNSIFKGPYVVRRKRALSFEDRNPHREASSGALTNVAGIFSDHASVIEAQGPGNVVEGKVSIPKFSIKSETVPTPTHNPVNHLEIIFHKDKVNPSVQPETSLEFNKTTLNGTTIEVSEIASPDHGGKVTITSIVPKFVRQNGNGHSTRTTSNHIPTSTTAIVSTNGRTKITLVGSNHPFSDETKNEEPVSETNVSDESIVPNDFATEESSIHAEFVTEASLALDETKTTIIAETEEVTQQTTLLQSDDTTEAEIITTLMPSSPSSSSTEPSTSTSTTSESSSTTSSSTTTSSTTTPSTTSTTTESTTSTKPTVTSPEPEDGKVESNFTCKDKELEQFYPDIENDCRLFHYCSPGFRDNEVLDLTFVCSNDTRFDIITKKCQDMNTVACGEPETTTATTSTQSSTSSSTSTTTTPITSSETPSSVSEPASSTTESSSTAPDTTTTSTTTTTTTTTTSTTTTVAADAAADAADAAAADDAAADAAAAAAATAAAATTTTTTTSTDVPATTTTTTSDTSSESSSSTSPDTTTETSAATVVSSSTEASSMTVKLLPTSEASTKETESVSTQSVLTSSSSDSVSESHSSHQPTVDDKESTEITTSAPVPKVKPMEDLVEAENIQGREKIHKSETEIPVKEKVTDQSLEQTIGSTTEILETSSNIPEELTSEAIQEESSSLTEISQPPEDTTILPDVEVTDEVMSINQDQNMETIVEKESEVSSPASHTVLNEMSEEILSSPSSLSEPAEVNHSTLRPPTEEILPSASENANGTEEPTEDSNTELVTIGDAPT